MSQRERGFTLIELMIVVAVIAILAAIAYPSYTQYIVRSARASAQTQMMDIANRQQQFLLANRAYATKDELQASGFGLQDEVAARYTYSIDLNAANAAPSFLITFAPRGSQTGDGNLTLNDQGVRTPLEKWTR